MNESQTKKIREAAKQARENIAFELGRKYGLKTAIHLSTTFDKYINALIENNGNISDIFKDGQSRKEIAVMLRSISQTDANKILAEFSRAIIGNKFKYNIQDVEGNSILYDLRNTKNNFRSRSSDSATSRNSKQDDPFNLNFTAINTNNGTGPSRSYYMSNNDFIFSESFNLSEDNPNKPYVQPIILNEFQPDQIILLNEIFASTVNAVFGGISKSMSIDSKRPSSLKIFLGEFAKVGTASLKAIGGVIKNVLIEEYSRNPMDLYTINNKTFLPNLANKFIGVNSNPLAQIYNLFHSGKWLNTYELPFFEDTYLQATKYENWNCGNLATSMR